MKIFFKVKIDVEDFNRSFWSNSNTVSQILIKLQF